MIIHVKRLLSVATLLVGTGFASVSYADWSLKQDASSLSFVSVKKDTVGEVHTFDSFSGQVTEEGVFALQVDLSSVNTQIEIRDQRMQEHLFDVKKFPLAVITGQVDKKWLSKLKKATPETLKTTVKINLHGVEVDKPVVLQVTKLDRKKVLVNSIQPILLDAADFGLSNGVATLKKLAALPNIAESIPVDVTLLFSK